MIIIALFVMTQIRKQSSVEQENEQMNGSISIQRKFIYKLNKKTNTCNSMGDFQRQYTKYNKAKTKIQNMDNVLFHYNK